MVGVSTAYHLARRGHDVLLLEKTELTAGYKASSRQDSTVVSTFAVTLVELTAFVNSTNITTNIETAVLSKLEQFFIQKSFT